MGLSAEKEDNHWLKNHRVAIRVATVVFTGLLSVALHSMAYDYGDRFDAMDLSQQETNVHLKMKYKHK